MQATSTSALELAASDQSLVWPPDIHKIKRTPHCAISDHASDQTGYTWINNKRPVACRVACFEDKTNGIKKKNEGAERPYKRPVHLY